VDVRVTRGIAFGAGRIGHGTPTPGQRDLLMDVYAPADAATTPRAGLILAFGGAFHRGSRAEDQYEEDGHRNTPIADYCRRFAAQGLVAFAIDYRLVPEHPGPAAHPVRRKPEGLPRGRIDHVRTLLGLPVATLQELVDGVEAAYADAALACRFVHAEAARWSVDPARVALGGFSSGGTAAIYAAYAHRAPAAAVVALSGSMADEDREHYIAAGAGAPPALLISGAHDLPGIGASLSALAAHLRRCEIPCLRYHVPGAPHFYPGEASAQPDGAGAPPQTVEQAIVAFLTDTIGPLRD
jgi:dienelactone hydrolase